jgi:ABC-type metal ion transport system substrate-binding protein
VRLHPFAGFGQLVEDNVQGMLALVNITYLIAAGGDPKTALIIDRTIDDGLVLRFTAKPEKKDDPRLKAFVEVLVAAGEAVHRGEAAGVYPRRVQ